MASERDPAEGEPSRRLAPRGKFPKAARIRRRREFVHVQSNGIRVQTSFVTIVAARVGSRPRLGCAISKKVGNAPTRNRIRRLFREIFRRMQADLPAVDFVVIAKPQIAPLANEGLSSLAAVLIPALDRAADRARAARKRSRGRPSARRKRKPIGRRG